MRIFAWSDLHADYRRNLDLLEAVPAGEYRGDALLVAGDVSHDLDLIERALALLSRRFAELFFVPGNHDVWVRGGAFADSLEKHAAVLALCARLGVRTEPARLHAAGAWVVPLRSWYVKPEQGEDTLYVRKPGEDASLSMWGDELFVRWPAGFAAADRFLAGNAAGNPGNAAGGADAPVVSFSHFLPRRELMFRTDQERAALGPGQHDRNPAFNFSRVAGTLGLERQLRALRSRVHVYGHQHRNRDRDIDGVRYVSHCLGYPGEGAAADAERPKRVWE